MGYRQRRGFTIWLGALPRWPVAPTQVSPSREHGGPFENPSKALGMLSRIGPLEVGVQWRALDNLLDGSGGLPKPHSLALAILPVLDSILDPSK